MELASKKQNIISIVMKAVAVIISLYGMRLTGFMFFTYFTNLSNIFIDIVLGVFCIQEIIALCKKKNVQHSNAAYRVKFLATISITLTFLVYMLILAPNTPGGVLHAYFANGATSFCVHFATPIIAIIDFLLFDYPFESTKKDALYGIIPPLCYVIYILILSATGYRWGTKKNMYAPYNFLNFGAETGWFGFDLSQMGSESFGVGVIYMVVVLILIFIGLGHLFLMLKDKRKRSVK